MEDFNQEPQNEEPKTEEINPQVQEIKPQEQPKKHARRSWVIFLVVGIIIGGLLGGILGNYIVFKNPSVFPWSKVSYVTTGNSNTGSGETLYLGSGVTSYQNAVENVVGLVSPSVVRIVSTQQVLNPFFLQTVPQQGLGSGVIIGSDGLILTNNHVIADANQIEVTLSNGKTYKGTVVGADPSSDVALVKIDASNLPYVTLGISSALKVGQFVVAIGNPYGLDHTVTTGVISALERNIDVNNSTMYGVIQTDAAINPGNSGGPLVDLNGNVIGINSMIYSGAEGLGFAVSSDTCTKVINSILKTGSMQWPYLGVSVATMTEDVASSEGIPYVAGAFVASVSVNSPASKAGIAKDDIIVSIDGTKIITADQLVTAIRAHSVGDKINIELVRPNSSNPVTLDVTLAVQS
jgi:serine protease Do